MVTDARDVTGEGQVAWGHVADSPWAGQVEVRECDALEELGRLAAAGEGPFQVRPGP